MIRYLVFFCKQKTAYEMRISDWSSDVCSSDLKLLEWAIFAPADVDAFAEVWYRPKREHSASDHRVMNALLDSVVQRFGEREEHEQEEFRGQQIGSASRRERVCPYV